MGFYLGDGTRWKSLFMGGYRLFWNVYGILKFLMEIVLIVESLLA